MKKLTLACLCTVLGISVYAHPKLDYAALNENHLTAVQSTSGTIIKSLPATNRKEMTPQFELLLPSNTAYQLGDAPQGTTPKQIRTTYGLSDTQKGAGAIAIVDAGLSKKVVDYANKFNQKYNLPLFKKGENITVLPQGWFSLFNKQWELETTLDLEAAHLMAPNAHIILVQTSSPLMGSFAKAIAVAGNELQKYGGGEISMSWGGKGSITDNKVLAETLASLPQNVTAFAASGDSGSAPSIYPASSADVVAVGGTTLHFDATKLKSQTAWSGGGGGLSLYYPRPSYQNKLEELLGNHIGTPDISLDADPNSGILVYHGKKWFGLIKAGFSLVGGTSLAAPLAAGLHNIYIQDGGKQISTSSLLSYIYSDIYTDKELYDKYFSSNLTGINGNLNHAGYDLVTGLGSPKLPI